MKKMSLGAFILVLLVLVGLSAAGMAVSNIKKLVVSEPAPTPTPQLSVIETASDAETPNPSIVSGLLEQWAADQAAKVDEKYDKGSNGEEQEQGTIPTMSPCEKTAMVEDLHRDDISDWLQQAAAEERAEREEKYGEGVYGGTTWWLDQQTQTPIALPHNGRIVTPSSEGYPDTGCGVLTIVASDCENCYVKLRDVYTDEVVLSFIVHAGMSVDVNIPFGEYELTYACGDEWFGYAKLFGIKTSYYKAEDTFLFEDYGDSVTWWTVELFLQYDGNLDTDTIDPDEF